MKKWFFLGGFVLVATWYIASINFWDISSYMATTPSFQKEKEITPLLFIGDVMLGRYVDTLAQQAGDELRSFRNMSSFLKGHVTIANLEGPIPKKHLPTLINGFSFSFPSSTPRLLKEGGITAVSLANNHMFDQGRQGWEETKVALDESNMYHFGGYAPTEADYFETSLGTRTVIVYGITMIATGWDERQALEITKSLRAQHPQAHLIAFLHWGDEYQTQNVYQEEFAHSLINNGVDAIIGSHPHILQGVEVYKGKPIFYSLGNFIFDQYWEKRLEDGLMVRLSYASSSYVYELIPVRSVRSVPSVADETERKRILDVVRRQSDRSLSDQIQEGVLRIPEDGL